MSLASRLRAINREERSRPRSNDIDFLLSDPQVEQLNSDVENGAYSLDLKRMREEVRQLHRHRKVSKLSFEQLGSGIQKTWIDADLENQANRSRIVGMYFDVLEAKNDLNTKMELLKPRLKLQYAGDLSKNFRTSDDRHNAIRLAMEPARRVLMELESMEELIKVALSDFDNSAWTLTGVREALKMTIGRGRD